MDTQALFLRKTLVTYMYFRIYIRTIDKFEAYFQIIDGILLSVLTYVLVNGNSVW
jgi:hypothetical protein